MARATWNGVVLAETSRPVLLEGNVYFPPEDVRREYLVKTRAWSLCPWKGLAAARPAPWQRTCGRPPLPPGAAAGSRQRR